MLHSLYIIHTFYSLLLELYLMVSYTIHNAIHNHQWRLKTTLKSIQQSQSNSVELTSET